MGCASSVVPQQQWQPRQARSSRPKHRLNALVPEPPSKPAAASRVGLISTSAPVNPLTLETATPIPVGNPHSYEELCVAFLKAVKRGDVAAMETVAQMGVRLTPAPQSLVNIRGMWDSTPLIYATQYAHAGAANWLLERGADVLAQSEKGVTALLLASLEGMTDVCAKILSVASLMGPAATPVDQQVGVVYNSAADTNVRLSPLLAASMNGHAGVVGLLLANGADPNRPVAAAVSGGVAVGAKQFALLMAAKYGHAAVLEILLARAVDLSVRDAAGSHAVLLACDNRREDCALLLLQYNAFDDQDLDGHADTSSSQTARRRIWLQSNRHGLTALHLTATHGLVDAARALLVLARQPHAANGGGAEVVEDLRAFLDAVSITRGETALLMACRKRQFDLARVLIEAGADVTRGDRGGTTPTQVLERSEQTQLLAMCRAVRLMPPARTSSEEGSEPPVGYVASPLGTLGTSDKMTAMADGQRSCDRIIGVSEWRNDVDEAEASSCSSHVSANDVNSETMPSVDACDQAPREEAAESRSRSRRLNDARCGDKATVDGGAADGCELDIRGASAGDGHVGDFEAGAASLLAASRTATLGDPWDTIDTPPHHGVHDSTSPTPWAAILIAPSTDGGINQAVPLEKPLVGRLAAASGAASGPTLLSSGDGDRAALVTSSSPRRRETEGDDDDEYPPSSASESPKKERRTKGSKRRKNRDKSSKEGPSSPSSPTRHRRRHQHRTAEESDTMVSTAAAAVAVTAAPVPDDGTGEEKWAAATAHEKQNATE